jgi:hypothetical protein
VGGDAEAIECDVFTELGTKVWHGSSMINAECGGLAPMLALGKQMRNAGAWPQALSLTRFNYISDDCRWG